MKRQLNTKEQWFASTAEEAEQIVLDAKEEFEEDLIGDAIELKSNKNGEYYLVKLNMKFNTPAGIMESELADEEDGDIAGWGDSNGNEPPEDDDPEYEDDVQDFEDGYDEEDEEE